MITILHSHGNNSKINILESCESSLVIGATLRPTSSLKPLSNSTTLTLRPPTQPSLPPFLPHNHPVSRETFCGYILLKWQKRFSGGLFSLRANIIKPPYRLETLYVYLSLHFHSSRIYLFPVLYTKTNTCLGWL